MTSNQMGNFDALRDGQTNYWFFDLNNIFSRSGVPLMFSVIENINELRFAFVVLL